MLIGRMRGVAYLLGAPTCGSQQGDFDRSLRATFLKMRAPLGELCRSHGFRRCSAQKIKEKGALWADVASRGMWNSPAFRGYADLSTAVESGVRNLSVVDSEPVAGDSAD